MNTDISNNNNTWYIFHNKNTKIKPGRERSTCSRLTSLQVEKLALIDHFFPSFVNKQQKVLPACRFDHVEKSFTKLIKKIVFFLVSALTAKFLNIQTVRLRERIIYFKKFWIVEYVVVFSSSRKYCRVSAHLFTLKYVEFCVLSNVSDSYHVSSL